MSKRKTRSDKFDLAPTDLGKVENLAALGLNMEQIASIFNVSADTFYRRCNEGNSELSAAILRGRTRSIQRVAEKAFQLALEGDVGLIKYILSCKGGWTEKSQIFHEGYSQNVNVSISNETLKQMAEEVLISLKDENE